MDRDGNGVVAGGSGKVVRGRCINMNLEEYINADINIRVYQCRYL